ncbi:ankyrin repeat protein [Botrytis cinerea]
MDGLGAAASVIAVVQMAQAVGGALVEYYEGVKSARDDIQRLYNSIKNLESVLRSVDDLLRTFSINIQASLENKTGTLSLCKAELDGIKKELDAFSKQQNHIGKLKSLIWPFKKKDVDKHVDFIDKHKHDLMLAFGVENLHISLRYHGILEDIRSEIGAAKSDKERRQIIKWLAESLPNPSTEHDIARKKCQKGTGSWLKDGDSLKIWSKTGNSFLWLNGGAGAGKSILCNRRDTPQILRDTYAHCNHGQQQPTHEKMMEMLKCVVGGFQDVYLIVDALDEYPKTDRYLLLKTLKEIHQWKIDSIHIFVTSRVEDDIRVYLANMSERNVFDNCKWIMVQDPNITEDIKKFLAAKIDSSEYDFPTSDLEEEVVESIARRAGGMFRLAALQLESLKPYQTIFEIRKGLNQLPRSLDVFYRRALEEVFEGHQCYVKIALQWIAYSARPLKLVELSEAVAVQTESSPYLEEDRKLICKGDRFPLVDMIPSAFVTIHICESGDPSLPFKEKSYIRFSHYSVQEFLQSTRTSNGPVKQYHLQESNGLESIAARCIAYLLYVGSFFEVSYSGLSDVHNRFPLIYHAVLCWTYYLQRLEILSNGSFNIVGNLRELASLLMSGNQATSTNHDAWKISQIICKDARRKIPYSATTLALAQDSFEIEIDSSIYIPCPLSWASHHGLISLVKLLLRDALYDISPSNASREFDLGSPLHAAATGWYFSERIVTLLLAAGMNPNTSGGELRYPLVAATDKNKLEICKLLCEGGANLDPGWVVRGETALQVACRKGYVDICEYLLEQGADIENCDFADDVAKHDFLDIIVGVGADIEAVYNGYTPLQYASEAHDVQACKWLLDSGSDVNHMTESVPFLTLGFPWRFRWTTSWTSLSRPFRVYPSFYPNDDLLVITELLLKAGADVHAKGGPWWKNGPMATTIVFCLECTRNLPESTEQREKHVLKKTLDMLLHAGAGSGLEGAEVLSILGGRREELKEERRELLRQREMNTRRSNDGIEEIDRFINSYDDAYNRVQEQQEKERKVSMRGVSTGDGVENE